MLAGYKLIDRPFPATGALVCRARRPLDAAPAWLIWPDPESSTPYRAAQLRRDFELLRSLDIPGLAKPAALVEDGGAIAMLVADCPGTPLEDLMQRDRPALPDSLAIAIRLSGILAALHRRGLVQGQLRPAHILIDPASGELCWLTLNLATELPSVPELGKLAPSDLAYLSPEQTGRINRPVDYRADFYSLGVLLYRLLTGQLPFTAADPMEWVHAHLARLPRPPAELAPEVPPVLSQIVMKLLAKAAEDRYRSALGLQFDLEACLAQFKATGRISRFPLGRQDVSERFRIPDKLYGREAEVAVLRETFDRVCTSGQTELVLVAGSSGIGKSSLVHELGRSVAATRACFIAGKFDQYRRDIPYATITEAFRELVRQLLAEPDAHLAAWRQKLLEALGGHARLIIELIPELELIIGPQPLVPELPPAEAQNRFRRIFRRFVGAFARPEHPLVIFLDDLQWIDAGTLALMEELITHPDTRHLLAIGAFREDQFEHGCPAGRAESIAARIEREGARVRLLRLGPLEREGLERLTLDSVHCAKARAAPLARLILAKTLGNPLFFIQFLNELHEEGLLHFNAERRAWTWDLAQIEGKAHTDNVLDLMIAKLERLPGLLRQTLQLAACLGGAFEAGTLALVAERPLEEIEADLRNAAGEGLLSCRDGTWRFLHDRVQEVAYSLLPEAERPALHLSIGRLLLAQLSVESAEQVFDVVDHLNRGADLIGEANDRKRLADLNALAGRKAKAAIAYGSARAYFARSAALLPREAWRENYADTFALHLEFAESEYLAGRFDAADQQFDRTLANAATDLDQAKVWRLRSRLYQTTARFDDAMAPILKALQSFGVELPRASEELAAATGAAMAEIEEKLRGRPIARLADAPAATDPVGALIISLLVEGMGPAYAAKPQYFPLLAAQAVVYTLRYGNVVESCIAYGAYAIVLVARPKTTHAGFEFSQMSLALLGKFEAPRPRGLVLVGHGGMIIPWLQHIAVGLPFVERGLAELVDAGDFLNAAYSAMFPVWAAFEAGKPLDEVLNTAETYATLAREVHHAMAYDTIRLCQRQLARLGEPTPDSTSFAGGEINEAESLARFAQTGWDIGIDYHSVIKQIAAFIGGRYAEASEAAAAAHAVLRYRAPMPLAATLCFYQTLAMAELYPAASVAEQQAMAPLLARNLEKYRLWAGNGPANHRNRHALLAAEVARIEGREADAMHAYEEAIAAAREQGFVQYEGLACERASSFYRGSGFAPFADLYLARARNCYLAWGAMAKVRQLDAAHPQLRPESPDSLAGLCSAQPLDALAIMKTMRAMRAISGEVVLERLLETLMRVVIENAGAQKGCLMLKRGEEMPLVATASVSGQAVQVDTAPEADDGSRDVPPSIVNYVRRTREKVVLDDASAANRFCADGYLARQRPKSLLCLPILQHGELAGLLYLENALITHAFTPDRLVVVELLALQAAISLDNAWLYADLQKEVGERRRAEEARQAGERTLRHLVEILPIAVYSCDASGRLENYNRRAVELWGREPRLGDEVERFCGSYRIFAPDGTPIPHAECPMAEVLRTGVAQSNREIVIERPDGSRRTVMVSPVPRRDERGNLTGAINCLTDITERKQGEESLRESRAMFQSLFESAPDAILVVEAESGKIVRCNRRAEAMFGCTADELRNQQVEVLLPERLRQRHPRYRADYLAHPHPRPMGTGLELYGRRKDGSEFPVDVTLGPVETEQGRLALSIVRDISERRLAEAERQARLAAEAASLAKSEFLANMSHELRSPLNTILGFARLMASDPALPGSARDDLDLILKSGEHLYALVNQVLDLSKLEAGRATFNEADFDLHLLLDDLRSLFAAAASGKGLQLLFARHRKVPRQVRGDPLKLRQVLINLLDNAIKLTRKGGVSVSVGIDAPPVSEPEAAESSSARLHFTVSDSGPGVAADELDELFDAFVQADAGRRTQHGTGLGLTISRGFVRLMGGEMRIESELGKGTTVSFDVPVGAAAQPGGAGETRFRRVLALAHAQPRYRILVVDDQAEARELIVRLLAPLGFKVKEAADGEAALQAWHDYRPDLIWLDLTIPGIDGYETSRRIRASPEGQEVVIVAVTAGGAGQERDAALAAGCNDLLRKPLREADLFATLEKFLGVRFVYEEETPASPRRLEAGALATLPLGQRTALEQALVQLDSDAVERTIDDIRKSDGALAQALAACAKDFQYESILAALHGEAARESEPGGGIENGAPWPAAGAS